LTPPISVPDPHLIALARSGDQRAIADLIAQNKHWLYRFIRRYVGDADDAQDVLQESFVAAVMNLARYDPQRPFDIWIRRIALNKCRDRARRLAVRRAIGLERRPAFEPDDIVDPAPPADIALQSAQVLGALDRAVAALPSALRAALVLTSLEGLSHKEAGEILGLSVKAVEVRVYRAKRQLALRLDRSQFGELLDR
jgi:RNA polymerase sigma-70 factor (ECF subfamily)